MTVECPALNGTAISHIPLPQAQGSLWEGNKKSIKLEVVGNYHCYKTVFSECDRGFAHMNSQ